ncbi:MAG: S-adenosyl-l-methionine hydroxide adenosyltransferase family protein [Candidatus Methanomethylicia archaeon]|nr:S-adenosyl-l-methionine hydroxide adenosyltransferase family protein [Candidatus Methanomethylicia archaeon]MCX8168892.1 S-adenosyl-l-methionine hydroxide adenosyltransferase family protein [Candidatus Methanomethylicia archaeon]MDW7988624.1 S-adenosyl-l-methionine hydroxide adenosyltransferase family protein [Nitrososphaerota archaeon]
MPSKPIITLLTDFGLKDSYIAEMKAVIFSICPEVNIVDISHSVEKFNIRMGAYLLTRASKYFPNGTIHVAVVDPGVGGSRRPIVIETSRALYVGPDNGILIPSAMVDGIKHIYLISNEKYMLRTISRTFHGRDIFSPVAAYLAIGVPPSEFGPEIFDPVIPDFAKPIVRGNSIEGEVIYIDDFGNVVTNIFHEHLNSIGIHDGDVISIIINNRCLIFRMCKSYCEVPIGHPLAIIGSGEQLELSINQGSAAIFFKISIGDKLILRKAVNS